MPEIEWNGKNIAEGECENKRNFKKFKALQRLASLGENKYFCSLNSTMEFEKKFISFGPTLNLQKGEDQLKKTDSLSDFIRTFLWDPRYIMHLSGLTVSFYLSLAQ